MNNLFYVGLIALAIFLFSRDFGKTKGFVLQKILHVFIILFLFITNLTAFKNFFAIIRNFKTFSEWSLTAKIEYLPIELSFLITFLSNTLSVMVYVLAFGLLSRVKLARKIIIWIIPFHVILMLPLLHFFYLHRYHTLEQVVAFWIITSFLLGYIGVFFIYKSSFMKKFFDAKNSPPSSSK